MPAAWTQTTPSPAQSPPLGHNGAYSRFAREVSVRFNKEGTVKGLVIALSIAVSATVAIVSPVGCHSSRPESPSTRVDKLLAEWKRPDSPGCSLAISRNGTL